MIDQEEIDYWLKEYPELDEEDIIDILEATEADYDGMGSDSSYTDYVEGEPEEENMGSILKRIIDPDD